MTNLLLHRLTDGLRDGHHDILALRLSGGGALLLRHGPGGGGALLLRHRGALLGRLSPGGGDQPGGAGGVRDVPAGRAGHRVVHSPALGSVVSLLVVAVPGLGLSRTQGERQQRNQEDELKENFI